jgi:glycosyltransferase involved in cell wall biosynthesis
MPKFSIIVPTRERPDTLRFALQTAVAQDFDDVEILVHESGDDPSTAEVVADIGDQRTRHLKTVEPVAMSENWERAVAAAEGEYLTIIGDDDGILPSACSEAGAILDRYPVEIVTWRPAAYFWPESAVTTLRNRLQAYLVQASGFTLQDPRSLLELAYHFRDHHYTMPMMLHSFVGRQVVERVRRRLDSYFYSAAPDIASGVADAFFGRSCILSHRPLSISGISHHSTGSRMHFNRDLRLRQEAETAAFDGVTFHPSLVNSRNSQLFAANEMMTMKQALFPDTEPAFDYRGLIQRALDSLATGLEDYETCLEDIRRTAELNGIDLEDFFVPPPVSAPGPAGGVQELGPEILLIDVDCAEQGLANVGQATGLLASLLPAFAPPRDLEEPVEYVRGIVRPSPAVVLDFSQEGNGLLRLGGGWGQAESWGVWSVARRAEVTLHLEGDLRSPLTVEVTGRMFVAPQVPAAEGSLRINGRAAAELRATSEQPAVKLRTTVQPGDLASGRVLLEFHVTDPQSPSSAGISADTRCLGFGLERIVVE